MQSKPQNDPSVLNRGQCEIINRWVRERLAKYPFRAGFFEDGFEVAARGIIRDILLKKLNIEGLAVASASAGISPASGEKNGEDFRRD